MDPKVVTVILDLLDEKYGQEIVGGKRAPLTINRGKKHDYLGMTLDYSEPGFVKIDMREYVNKVLGEMPEDMDGMGSANSCSNAGSVPNRPGKTKSKMDQSSRKSF